VFFRHASKSLDIAEDLQSELEAAGAGGSDMSRATSRWIETDVFDARKRKMADFLLGKSKSD
jgi:hypothetical protein